MNDADDCAALLANALPNQAEPFTVETDLSQASLELEWAVLSSTEAMARQHVGNVLTWLQRASDVYQSGERSPRLADDVDCATTRVQSWLAMPSWGDLATFQRTQLYPFQGVLSQLMGEAAARGARDAVIVSNAVFTLILVVLGGQIYRSAQRAQGMRSR